ncbi:MAG: hypothetical protein P8P74_01550 [Crocinitomicaceae bacterium]|nr:hypothetical protein [Crocinitomicaceae bacterium]
MTKNLLMAVFAILMLASCGKYGRKATIDRDCTGTYLEINNKDYLVCNPSMINSYPDGTSLKVKYNTVPECRASSDTFFCELYHKNYGSIEITEIK